MKNIFMFDVENVNGLYGEGFAVGAIVSDLKGNIIDTFELKSLEIESKNRNKWVADNVIPYLKEMKFVKSGLDFRNKFYEFYLKYKEDSYIFSDCNYPVETKFLNDVVNDNKEEREWKMPYPLYDVCNFVKVNIDRTEKYNKDNSGYILQDVATRKLRVHNPFDDSKASLYCLVNSRSFKKFIRKESKK